MTRTFNIMPPQRQATGWISTDKTFSDANKKKKLKALSQTSMLAFLEVKSKGQKENRASPSRKRKSDAYVDSTDSTSKKRRKDMATSRGPPESQNSNECDSCSLYSRRTTPILLSEDDSPDFVHEESTACNSALSMHSPEPPSVARKFNEILSSGTDVSAGAPLYANVISSLAPQTVVASSQVEEMETLFSPRHFFNRKFVLPPSPVRYVVPPKPDDDSAEETVPSSQSQYLLPYEASPIRPRRVSNKIYVGDEIVPSSQSQTHTELNLSEVYGIELNEKESIEGRAVIYGDSQESEALGSSESIPLQGHKTPFTPGKQPDDENPIGKSWYPDNSARGFDSNTKQFFENPHRVDRSPSPLLSGIRMVEEDPQSHSLEKTCPQEFIDFFDRFGSLGSDTQEALSSEKGFTQGRRIRDNLGGHLSVNQKLPIVETKSCECGSFPSVNQEHTVTIPSSSMSESQSQLPSDHESRYTYIEKTCPSFLAEFFKISEGDLGSLGNDIDTSDMNSLKTSSTHLKSQRAENDLDSQRSQTRDNFLFASSFPILSEEEASQSTYTERTLPADFAEFFNSVEENSLRLN